MYYVNNRQKEILNVIDKFGCVRENQLELLSGIHKVGSLIKPLINQKRISLNNGIYTTSSNNRGNKKVLDALDVYLYLNSVNDQFPVEWCELSQFPFTLTLFRNGKAFDIAVIDEGEEISYSAAINRSNAERVIIVIKSSIQIDKIKIEKEIRLCKVEEESVNFFEV